MIPWRRGDLQGIMLAIGDRGGYCVGSHAHVCVGMRYGPCPRRRGHGSQQVRNEEDPSMSVATVPHAIVDAPSFRHEFLRHVTYGLGETVEGLSPREAFRAVALVVRDRMVGKQLSTEHVYRHRHAKRLYYLSLEFLIGRLLVNNLMNLGLLEDCREVLREFGIDFRDVEEAEVDAALGNGGLGRLAACFLDSLATLGLPGFGYGIDYEYGLFRQEIRNGQQVEKPDAWRSYASVW